MTTAVDQNELMLDEMFGWVERMPAPEGFKVEIVDGAIYMEPKQDLHWQCVLLTIEALEDRFGRDISITHDVRIDFPGDLNGFAPDVAKMRDGAGRDSADRWHYGDVEFIAEVISKHTAVNDYGPKKVAYAVGGVPVYLIVDPYRQVCRLCSVPEDGGYAVETEVAFGVDLDLSPLAPQFVLKTEAFLES